MWVPASRTDSITERWHLLRDQRRPARFWLASISTRGQNLAGLEFTRLQSITETGMGPVGEDPYVQNTHLSTRCGFADLPSS
jgi:hypothetical protein